MRGGEIPLSHVLQAGKRPAKPVVQALHKLFAISNDTGIGW